MSVPLVPDVTDPLVGAPPSSALLAAVVVIERRRRGPEVFCSWVVARCPYCGQPHRHGPVPVGADPRAHLGPRRAHCWPGGEYHLVEAG